MIKVWDADKGKRIRTPHRPSGLASLRGPSVPIAGDWPPLVTTTLSGCGTWTRAKKTGRWKDTLPQLSPGVQLGWQTLASASHDKTIKVWNTNKWQETCIAREHTDAVRAVAFSPDGKRFTSASDDRTVRVWDAETGTELHCLTGHTDWVYGVAFSCDGKRIASAGKDATVKIWNADNEKGNPDTRGTHEPGLERLL